MTGNSDLYDVLRLLYLEGMVIAITDSGKPVVRGGTPTPALRDHLQRHRKSILALAIEQGIGSAGGYVTPQDCIAERACRRIGWCTQSLMHRSCSRVVLDAESEEVLT